MELDERLALAHEAGTPALTLIDLAADPSAQVRAVVAARPDAPAQALRPLTRDHDRDVREAVARNPSTSQGNLLRLVGDADRWVRWAVAGNPGCDERVRRTMAAAADKELRGLLAEHPDLEPDLAQALLGDPSPEVRERLAAQTRIPAVLTALLADRTVRVRKGLARNPRTTPEQRHALAVDSAVDVRCELVGAVDLAEDDLRLLVHDRSAQVRLALATSPRTPAPIRQLLEDDADEAVATAARNGRTVPATRPARRGPNRFVTGRGR